MSFSNDIAPVTEGILEDANEVARRRQFSMRPELPETPEEGLRRMFEICASMENALRKNSTRLRKLSPLGEFVL